MLKVFLILLKIIIYKGNVWKDLFNSLEIIYENRIKLRNNNFGSNENVSNKNISSYIIVKRRIIEEQRQEKKKKI